jgi:hypothetical protein
VYAAPSVRKDEPVLISKDKPVPVPPIQVDEPVPSSKVDPAPAENAFRVDEPVHISKDDPAPIVYAAPAVQKDEPVPISKDDPVPTIGAPDQEDKVDTKTENIPAESENMQMLEQLKI